ncbi:MAG: MarR family winged helix-turn-helix transcriptional regulator [Butyribacter sp.]|nr:MarR family winged helix-turn-helix transcriptional regulator [bacterium]MDY3855083.1 MarR family winged helix-turn-helix transcriptional regulator [Butyribacter sp.]
MAIERLGIEIRILSNLIYHKMNQITTETDNLTVHQCFILQYLAQNKDKENYQKDIEELFSIKRSTANQMLRTLENRGYISRETSAQDSRKNIITLTEEGSVSSEHLTQHMYQFMKKLHGDISSEELEQFEETLKKLWHNIES